jgi:RNA polymerase sigma-70 factor (ECF subfamily)
MYLHEASVTFLPVARPTKRQARCRKSIVQDEASLLMRARKLDAEALALIHDTYYGPIFRYIAFRVSDRTSAEDLASEVFMRLLEALRTHKAPQTSLRSWLYGVASHVVSDFHRKRYRDPRVALDEALLSQAAGPDEIAEALLDREELRRALALLTVEQQHVIALRFGAGLPIQEVARSMDKTEGAVKQLQARAIAALARQMAPRIDIDG